MNLIQQIKAKFLSFTEEIIVGIVMIFVLLPVRVIFVTYITPHWFGSFGLISIVLFTLVILSKKNKLGMFGRMFWRQISKMHKGKRRIISYCTIAILLYFWGSVIYGINYANDNPTITSILEQAKQNMSPQDKQTVQELNEAIENKDIEAVRSKLQTEYRKTNWDIVIMMIPVMFLSPIFDIDYWASITYATNEFSNGYFLHFGTVFFVEALEVVGIMIYTKLITRTNKHNYEA